jgi:hypothetical protein
MTTLSGIDLGNGLYRENHLGRSGVDGSMVRSRDGTPIVWEQPAGPPDFNLVGGSTTGTLAGSVLLDLYNLASVPGGVYLLEHNGKQCPVRFRTWDQPVIQADPIAPRENMTDMDVYNNIVIKFQEA